MSLQDKKDLLYKKGEIIDSIEDLNKMLEIVNLKLTNIKSSEAKDTEKAKLLKEYEESKKVKEMKEAKEKEKP